MIKLKNSCFDREDGCSEVTISTEIGDFCGYAFLHPEDEKIQSRFFGCEIAEARAYIYYYEEKVKRLNFELNTLYSLKKDFKILAGLQVDKIKILPNTPECNILIKRIQQKEDYKALLQKRIRILNVQVNERIKEYEIEASRIKAKIEKDK